MSERENESQIFWDIVAELNDLVTRGAPHEDKRLALKELAAMARMGSASIRGRCLAILARHGWTVTDGLA